ncbi:MAG: pyridoxamine 5'-phosphate oxidase family protein [Acidimicrobiia bacterium]|nr:pyridoxamine 5'-phosphate oxidase family protein [Acidimicrobiia bacterium]MDH4363079.1 pyridoxamine 5'-phosphate oxidase family protein [Acidimicrobiia bacterium]
MSVDAPPPPTPISWSDIAGQLTGLAHVATASADGEPHVAVVAPVLEGDVLWIFTMRSSRKARNLAANPRISLMWRPQSEIYITARAELVDSAEDKARLWARTDLPFDPAAFFGTPDNPGFVLVRVTPRRAVVMGPTGRAVWSAG